MAAINKNINKTEIAHITHPFEKEKKIRKIITEKTTIYHNTHLSIYSQLYTFIESIINPYYQIK
jgi:hypothetical protein